jgi:hypothetical protein
LKAERLESEAAPDVPQKVKPPTPDAAEAEAQPWARDRTTTAAGASVPGTAYEPTPEEQVVIEKFLARKAAKCAPRVAVTPQGEREVGISLQHPDKRTGWRLLLESTGTADMDFFMGLLNQLPVNNSDPAIAERELNFLLSVIQNVNPRDQVEAMLAAQIAAGHLMTMKSAQRHVSTQSREASQLYEGGFNRSARTFAALIEALKRYRTGGEQKITVQHVQNMQNVAVDGPAIVGNVTHGGSKAAAEPVASPPALVHDPKPSMPIIDQPAIAPVPVRARGRRKVDK